MRENIIKLCCYMSLHQYSPKEKVILQTAGHYGRDNTLAKCQKWICLIKLNSWQVIYLATCTYKTTGVQINWARILFGSIEFHLEFEQGNPQGHNEDTCQRYCYRSPKSGLHEDGFQPDFICLEPSGYKLSESRAHGWEHLHMKSHPQWLPRT